MDRLINIQVGAQARGDRVRVWKQLLDENVMGVECDNAGDDLQASVAGRLIESGAMTRARFSSQTLSRTPSIIRQSPEEAVLIAFVQEGTHLIRQGDQSAMLEGAGTYILDGTRPFEVDFASEVTVQSVICVPKAALTKRIGALDQLAFGQTSPLQKLVSTFALGTIRSFETLDAETLDVLLNQTLDLFALMVAEGRQNAIDPSTHQAGMLLRIKSYVRAHLRDEALTLKRTAHALGISTRYVNALLATEGTSFGRYLLAARLEGARREIMDPRHANKQVTEVAFEWGFNDASHFGRAFKEKFGLTPREAKWRKP